MADSDARRRAQGRGIGFAGPDTGRRLLVHGGIDDSLGLRSDRACGMSSAQWQATVWPGANSRNAGRSSSHRSVPIRTAGMEPTAGRGFAGDGRSPGSRIRTPVSSITGSGWDRRHQRLGVRSGTAPYSESDGACSTMPPRYITATHRHVADDGEVVRDDHIGRVPVVLQFLAAG